jgi:hypothetical protein
MALSLRNLRLPRRATLAATVAVILGVAAYAYWMTTKMQPSFLLGYPGDAFFPSLVLALIGIFGLVVLVKTLASPLPPETPPGEPDGPVQIDIIETLTVAGLGIGFILILYEVGLEIATFLMMFALLFPRFLMPWPKAALWAAVGAACTLVVIYLGFVVGLNVFLPLRFLPTSPF